MCTRTPGSPAFQHTTLKAGNRPVDEARKHLVTMVIICYFLFDLHRTTFYTVSLDKVQTVNTIIDPASAPSFTDELKRTEPGEY